VPALEARIHMTIVDPVEAGCWLLRAVVESGLQVSHAGIYARPAPQRMHDLEDTFAVPIIELLKG
jgi:hypothetical protein